MSQPLTLDRWQIFFPRSIEGEIARADRHRMKNYSSNSGRSQVSQNLEAEVHDMYDLHRQPSVDQETAKSSIIFERGLLHQPPLREGATENIVANDAITPLRLEPNRRHSPPAAAIGHRQAPSMSTAYPPAGHVISSAQLSSISQLVKTFKSPFGMSFCGQ